jgi:hypothetical protein
MVNLPAVEKSVVFIQEQIGPQESGPLATGFLIGVPTLDGKSSYVLLLTARHVVDPVWARCAPHENPTSLVLRLNLKNYSADSGRPGFGTRRVPLIWTSDGRDAFVSEDDAVDGAVVLLRSDELGQDFFESFDVTPINISDFATADDERNIGVGDSVVSAGLLPTFPGAIRNYPVFKFGHIAAKPEETVQFQCGPNELPRAVRTTLVAINLVPGNSGSPIVYAPSLLVVVKQSAPRRAVVLGIQSLSLPDSDVAGMAPISAVYRIIEEMRLPNADLRLGVGKPNVAPPKP